MEKLPENIIWKIGREKEDENDVTSCGRPEEQKAWLSIPKGSPSLLSGFTVG